MPQKMQKNSAFSQKSRISGNSQKGLQFPMALFKDFLV